MKTARFIKAATLLLSGILLLETSFPVQALAIPEEQEDQAELSADEIAAAVANGEVDLSSLSSGEEGIALAANGDYALTTIGGSTRYDTSAMEALSAFSSAGTVIITGGESYADSTAGAGLAGALNAPILLTSPSELSQVTSDAIETLGASRAIILGGTAAVSANVESQLKSLVGNVERIAGATRYETQLEIVKYGVDNDLWSGDYVAVTCGEGFADALSFSPVAFSLKIPVFFTDGSAGLTQEELCALQGLGKSNALLIGGSRVVSAGVESQLASFSSVKRLGGETRYNTSYEINSYAVNNFGFSWEYVAFCSGQVPWDSLGGGAMQGKNKRLLSLLDNNGAKTEPSIYVDGKPGHAIFLGGKNVYPNSFKAQFAYKKGYSITDIQGFKVYIDAGHGWNSSNNDSYDGGAEGCGYQEASLTQELADKVAWVLNNTYGVETYVNKSGWYKLRQAQASELDCGLFLSIHFNAGGGKGSESYIHTYNAQWGASHLQDCVTGRLADAVGRGNRGAGNMQLAVCGGNVPATLVEVCFIDNSGDMSAYQSRKDGVARALAEGVVSW